MMFMSHFGQRLFCVSWISTVSWITRICANSIDIITGNTVDQVLIQLDNQRKGTYFKVFVSFASIPWFWFLSQITLPLYFFHDTLLPWHETVFRSYYPLLMGLEIEEPFRDLMWFTTHKKPFSLPLPCASFDTERLCYLPLLYSPGKVNWAEHCCEKIHFSWLRASF